MITIIVVVVVIIIVVGVHKVIILRRSFVGGLELICNLLESKDQQVSLQ